MRLTMELMNPQTDDLYESIVAILEVTTTLYKCYAAHLQVSAHVSSRKQQTSVSRRRGRGGHGDETSEDESDEDEEVGEDVSRLPDEESLESRVRKMKDELALCVATIIKGVDRLANKGGTADTRTAAASWALLSFALGDWQMAG